MKKFIYTFVLVFFLLLVGCVTIYNPATQRKEYYFIDENAEIAIGRNVAQSIIKNNKIYDDVETLTYLRGIGDKIGAISHRNNLDYNFYIIDEEEINAFALPGGYIFVNKGLIDKADEDELGFVLAHEIAHVSARHSLKKLQASLGLGLLIDIALGGSEYVDMHKAVNIVYEIVALGHSRKDELLADSLAVGYVHLAKYDPEAAFTLFDKMKKEKDKGYTLVFLRSHPLIEDRVANIKEKIKTLN